MARILLVRHGQASFGHADYDALSPLGFEQAALLGRAFSDRGIVPDLIVHGDMRRHRETAEACAAAAGWAPAERVTDERWNEFDFLGVLAQHPPATPGEPTKAQFQEHFEAATQAWIAGQAGPYPETFEEFESRVRAGLHAVAATAAGTVVVFTSGGPIALAAASILALGLADPQAAAQLWTRLNRMTVNTAVTRILAGSRGLNLLGFNDQSHLDGVAGAISYR